MPVLTRAKRKRMLAHNSPRNPPRRGKRRRISPSSERRLNLQNELEKTFYVDIRDFTIEGGGNFIDWLSEVARGNEVDFFNEILMNKEVAEIHGVQRKQGRPKKHDRRRYRPNPPTTRSPSAERGSAQIEQAANAMDVEEAPLSESDNDEEPIAGPADPFAPQQINIILNEAVAEPGAAAPAEAESSEEGSGSSEEDSGSSEEDLDSSEEEDLEEEDCEPHRQIYDVYRNVLLKVNLTVNEGMTSAELKNLLLTATKDDGSDEPLFAASKIGVSCKGGLARVQICWGRTVKLLTGERQRWFWEYVGVVLEQQSATKKPSRDLYFHSDDAEYPPTSWKPTSAPSEYEDSEDTVYRLIREHTCTTPDQVCDSCPTWGPRMGERKLLWLIRMAQDKRIVEYVKTKNIFSELLMDHEAGEIRDQEVWETHVKDKYGDKWMKVVTFLNYLWEAVEKKGYWPKDHNLFIYGDPNMGKSLYFMLFFFIRGLRGWKIRHDKTFNDRYKDGHYHFAYSDDWDFSKSIEWLIGFTDPSLANKDVHVPPGFEDMQGFLKAATLRNPGGGCSYKCAPLMTVLISNKSPKEGWPNASDALLKAFYARFWVIYVDQRGNIFEIDNKDAEVIKTAKELIRQRMFAKGVDLSGIPGLWEPDLS